MSRLSQSLNAPLSEARLCLAPHRSEAKPIERVQMCLVGELRLRLMFHKTMVLPNQTVDQFVCSDSRFAIVDRQIPLLFSIRKTNAAFFSGLNVRDLTNAPQIETKCCVRCVFCLSLIDFAPLLARKSVI